MRLTTTRYARCIECQLLLFISKKEQNLYIPEELICKRCTGSFDMLVPEDVKKKADDSPPDPKNSA